MVEIDLEEFLKMLEFWKEHYELDDLYYLKAIEACPKVPKWDKKLVYRYLIRFLELYGVPARNTTGVDLKNLAEAINRCNSSLKQFDNTDLLGLNLDERRKDIINLFEEINNVNNVGPTSISKILHLLRPEVFVMWDEKIAKLYDTSENAKGYFEFLKICKSELKELLEEFRRLGIENPEDKLRKRYEKPLTKLIDEYNWLKAWENDKQMIKRLLTAFSIDVNKLLNQLKY